MSAISRLKRKQNSIDRLKPVKPKLSKGVSVDVLQLPDALHFSCSFSFDIKTGRNNFVEICELVDKEMNNSRQEIINKIAKHLQVQVNFNQ